MFIQLTIEQISERWPILRKALEASHPPTSLANDFFFQKNLRDLLTGYKQAWVWADTKGDVGYVISTFIDDFDSKQKFLLIYTAYALEDCVVEGKLWMEGLKGLFKFAASTGCSKIVAFTNQEKVIKLANHVGMTAIWQMLEMEV